MDKHTLEYLSQHNMASLMNSTKWRELAVALQRVERGGPRVRLKYLRDAPSPGFAHLDWEWVKYGETSIIEWMEIDTRYTSHRGRLVQPEEKDLGEAIAATLRAVGVAFSREGHIIKVWGHVSASDIPTLL